MSAFVDITGRSFGRLVVIGHAGKRGKNIVWRCRCSCGVECIVLGEHLKTGHTASCGCLGREALVAAIRTHGHSRTPTYEIWSGMRKRCENRNASRFRYYGARGITVCERWRAYENFLADMGLRPSECHSLDRIDNSGNYEPGNCRWATVIEQRNNTRSNRLITHMGREQTLTQWCRELGISASVVHDRLNKLKWNPVAALTTPLLRQGKRILL